MPLVEHADETRLPPFGRHRNVRLTTGGHNHEWRVADEVLDIGGHIIFHFSDRPPTGRDNQIVQQNDWI